MSQIVKPLNTVTEWYAATKKARVKDISWSQP